MNKVKIGRLAAMLVAVGSAITLAINGQILEAVATVGAAFSSTNVFGARN